MFVHTWYVVTLLTQDYAEQGPHLAEDKESLKFIEKHQDCAYFFLLFSIFQGLIF